MRMSGNGLFLVRFRRESGRERITQAGGRIVYTAGSDAVLVVIAVNGYFSLKNDRAIPAPMISVIRPRGSPPPFPPRGWPAANSLPAPPPAPGRNRPVP